MWLSGNHEGYGGVGVLVKEELYDKVFEVRRVNGRVMSLAIVFEDMVRVVFTYAPQNGKWMEEKENFYKEIFMWNSGVKDEI